MKEFNLTAKVTISISTTVEAKTLEEAIEIAEQRHIEHHNWRDEDQEKEAWVSSEYDGEPYNIEEA